MRRWKSEMRISLSEFWKMSIDREIYATMLQELPWSAPDQSKPSWVAPKQRSWWSAQRRVFVLSQPRFSAVVNYCSEWLFKRVPSIRRHLNIMSVWSVSWTPTIRFGKGWRFQSARPFWGKEIQAQVDPSSRPSSSFSFTVIGRVSLCSAQRPTHRMVIGICLSGLSLIIADEWLP